MPWTCGTVTWRFVDEEQKVAGEVVEQGGRRLAGQAAGEVARVVLDAVAVADGLDHLQVEAGALVDALGLDQAALPSRATLSHRFELVEDGVAWRRSCARAGRRSGTSGRWGGAEYFCRTVPKSGSICESESISSPKSSMR